MSAEVAISTRALGHSTLFERMFLSFSELCLCLVPQVDGSTWWWMRQLEYTDASIAC
jgi:hypothetical protein